jgi:hypothetical protein
LLKLVIKIVRKIVKKKKLKKEKLKKEKLKNMYFPLLL